jgi:2-dehydropantoate 2-reductase
MGGITTDKIVGDADLRELATKVMREVVAAGNADLDSVHADARHRLDEAEIVERLFRLTDNMGPYRPSTMIDMVEGRPMEVIAPSFPIPCPPANQMLLFALSKGHYP